MSEEPDLENTLKMEKLMSENLSLRGRDWIDFSIKVLHHIETYTVPQYNDRPNDQMTNWTVEDCLTAVKKRLDRFGRNSREGQQELDFLKMAHEVQLAADKYAELPVVSSVDDVCEWEMSEDSNLDFSSSCGNRFSIDAFPDKYNFCLNCGKKLRIVT